MDLLKVVRTSRTLLISEASAFYFFPEWATDNEFFNLQLESNKARLAQWDSDYNASCDTKLDGHDLGANKYALFKDYRLTGLNHNAVAVALRGDDVEALERSLKEANLTPTSLVPRSIFDRFKYGKTKPVPLIDYCCLIGGIKGFRWLLDNGATVSPETGMYLAIGCRDEIMQEFNDRKFPLDLMLLGGMRAYHFSLLKSLHETKALPIDSRSVLEFARHKLKGIFYLYWRNEDFAKIMSTERKMQKETSDAVLWEHILLLRAVEYNDMFIPKVISLIDGFNIMAPTNQKYSTALHAAAAFNSPEVLRFLLTLPSANVNASDRSDTPLIAAAQKNAAEAVEVLVESPGIDVNLISNDRTALMSACEYGSVAACRVLTGVSGIDAKMANSQVAFFLMGFLLFIENCSGFLRGLWIE
jgi:hypothetical protein